MKNNILQIKISKRLNTKLKELSKKENVSEDTLIKEAIQRYIIWKEFKLLQKELYKKGRKIGIRKAEDVERLIDDVRRSKK